MTQAQLTLIVKLAGGLNEAGKAAVDFDVLDSARSNKKDRVKALMSIPSGDASLLIEHLGGLKLGVPVSRVAEMMRIRPGSEGAEDEDGYMMNRGEDN